MDNVDLQPLQKLSETMRGEFSRFPVGVLQELREALRWRMLMLASDKVAQDKERLLTCSALLRAAAEALVDAK